MRKTKYPTHVPISIEYDGKQYAASYYVEKGMVTLWSAVWGSKSAVIHQSPEQLLAEIMLREVLDAAKGRGEL